MEAFCSDCPEHPDNDVAAARTAAATDIFNMLLFIVNTVIEICHKYVFALTEFDGYTFVLR